MPSAKSGLPWASLGILAVGSFVIVCSQSGTSGLIADIAAGLGTTDGGVGIAVTVFSAAVAISTLPMFVVLRRRSRKTVLVLGFAGAGVSSLAASAAPNLALFVVSRMAGGVAHGLFSMALMAYIALTVQRRFMGRALAIAGAGSALAMWVGIPMVTWIGYGPGGWRLSFGVIGAAALVVATWVLFGLPRDPDRPRSGSARLEWWRLGMWGTRARALVPVWQANATSVANAASFYVVFSFIGTWLGEVAHVSGSEVAAALLVAGTGAMAGMAAAGPVSDLWGTRRGQTSLAVWLVAQSLLLAAVGALSLGGGWMWVAMFLLGVPGGALAIVQQARVTELTPEPLQKATAAAQSVAGNGGMALAGGIGGLLIAGGATWLLPWATVVFALIALCLDHTMSARLRTS